jgi:hypothetical protein
MKEKGGHDPWWSVLITSPKVLLNVMASYCPHSPEIPYILQAW